jgi:hypothetical protein
MQAFSLVCFLLLAAADPIVLDGPDGPVAVGQSVQVFVSGIGEEALPTAYAGHWPRKQTTFVPARTWGGKPFIWFAAARSGEYLISVCVAENNTIRRGELVIVVGEGDDDENPPPPPPPPQPGKRRIRIIEESKDRTPAQARVMLSPELRKYCAQKNHAFLLRDKTLSAEEEATPVGKTVVFYRQLAAERGIDLPAFFVAADDDRQVLYAGPFPATTEEAVKLIQDHGG